jgi:hypothetical protein
MLMTISLLKFIPQPVNCISWTETVFLKVHPNTLYDAEVQLPHECLDSPASHELTRLLGVGRPDNINLLVSHRKLPPGGSSPRPPFSRFARHAVTGSSLRSKLVCHTKGPSDASLCGMGVSPQEEDSYVRRSGRSEPGRAWVDFPPRKEKGSRKSEAIQGHPPPPPRFPLVPPSNSHLSNWSCNAILGDDMRGACMINLKSH